MEINELLLAKGRFIGLYYGQLLAKIKNSSGLWIVGMSLDYSETILELNRLSDLTEEDAAKIPRRNYVGERLANTWNANDFYRHSIKNGLSVEEGDYLRSMGYAIEWKGISVAEQLDRKWITFKNK